MDAKRTLVHLFRWFTRYICTLTCSPAVNRSSRELKKNWNLGCKNIKNWVLPGNTYYSHTCICYSVPYVKEGLMYIEWQLPRDRFNTFVSTSWQCRNPGAAIHSKDLQKQAHYPPPLFHSPLANTYCIFFRPEDWAWVDFFFVALFLLDFSERKQNTQNILRSGRRPWAPPSPFLK